MVGKLQTNGRRCYQGKSLNAFTDVLSFYDFYRERVPENFSSRLNNPKATGIAGWRTCKTGASRDNYGGVIDVLLISFVWKGKFKM
jgi:hypothetical protein